MDVLGPYGTDPDDNITAHGLGDIPGMREWCRHGDQWITDRGFHLKKPQISNIVGKTIEIETPVYLHGRAQFTHEETMESTVTASTRSINECVHAHMKYPFKLLFNLYPVKMLDQARDWFIIASGIVNTQMKRQRPPADAPIPDDAVFHAAQWSAMRRAKLNIAPGNPITELCQNRVNAEEVRARVIEAEKQTKAKRRPLTRRQTDIVATMQDQNSLPDLSPDEELLWYDSAAVATVESKCCEALRDELRDWTSLAKKPELRSFITNLSCEIIPTTDFILGVSENWTISHTPKYRIRKANRYLSEDCTYCKVIATTLSDDKKSRIYYGKCRSSYRATSQQHQVLLPLSSSADTPHYLYCSCKAGLGTNCSHIVASLLLIQHLLDAAHNPLPVNKYHDIETIHLITGKIGGRRPAYNNINAHRTTQRTNPNAIQI